MNGPKAGPPKFAFQAVAGYVAILVGGLVLIGWTLDIGALKSLLPGWVSMKPNTALAFMLTGVALVSSFRTSTDTIQYSPFVGRVARFCGWLACSIGVLTLSEYVFGWDFGIDQRLFLEASRSVGTSHPGRMAPDTAICFVLLAAGLEIGHGTRTGKRALFASAVLGLLVTTVAAAAVLAYSTPSLRAEGWAGLTIMAPVTALTLAVLGAAMAAGSWRRAAAYSQTQFTDHLWRMVGCAGALAIAFILYARSEQQIIRANEVRHLSFLLADELRQSGDDLTRMARTYVVTGDPAYKQRFQDILDIRDGKKRRPENYARPYWDLILADGPAPRRSLQPVPLLELMRQAGFSEREFRKLAEAKANSDGLTIPEFEAMKLVESTGPQAEANRARARTMMYDANYHRAKAAVMGPIHDFLVLVDTRTSAGVQAAEDSARIFRYLFAAAGLALMVALWRTYAALGNILGGSLDDVHAHIARIGSGDITAAIPVKAGQGNSVLGWLSETQAELKTIDEERRRTEERVRTEKLLVDSLITSLPGIFYVFNEHGRFLRWNANFESVTGYSSAEVAALSPLDMFVGDERVSVAQRIQRVFVEGFADVEAHLVSKFGGRTAYHFTGSRIEFNGHPCLVGVGLDITDRERAEEGRVRLAAIVDSSTDAIIAKTPTGLVTSWNAAAERLFGYSAEEMIGQPIIRLSPPDRQEEEGQMLRQIRRDERVDSFDTLRVHKDGRVLDVSLVISPIKDGEGRVVGASTIARDVGERRRAEAEIRCLNATLEQRVRDRTADLEAANGELEAFSYSVSHDLRAPLRAIDGYGRILAEDYEDRLDAEGKRVLGVISSETNRMGQLVDDLLAFSQLGRQALVFSPIDMTALAKAVFEEQVARVPRRLLELKLSPLPPAHGDRAMIRVVLGNLLSNAIKFTAPRNRAVIEIGSLQQDGQAVYYVKDNGVGFDMTYAHKLFKVFQRLHSMEQFEGTGVGLALAERVIHRHNGRIWADGAVNNGATFSFSLPAMDEKQ